MKFIAANQHCSFIQYLSDIRNFANCCDRALRFSRARMLNAYVLTSLVVVTLRQCLSAERKKNAKKCKFFGRRPRFENFPLKQLLA